MPVKVRCSGCQKVLNAPDKARGKGIKCPECGAVVKVPAGDAPITPPGKKKKAEPEKPVGSDSAEFLAGLGVQQFESEGDQKLCPYCAHELKPEQIVCPKCGMNTQTGQMDSKEAKKRARKGPDPALFYKAAWKDAWAYLKQHWRLAFRSGIIWMTVMTFAFSCWYMIMIWVFPPLPPGVEAPEPAQPRAAAIVEEGGEPAEDTGERSPWVAFSFWMGMGCVFILGVPGWYWALTLKIVDATLQREEIKEDRIHFDLFESVALGLRSIFWPFVMMVPFLPLWALLVALAGGGLGVLTDPKTLVWGPGVVAVIVAFFAVPYLVFPQAIVHMSVKYRHNAWIFWEQVKDLFRNFGATLYWWIVALTVSLPLVALAVVILLDPLGWFRWSFQQLEALSDLALGSMINTGLATGERSLLFMLLTSILIPIVLFPIMFVLGMLMGFPAFFMMRVTGLYGHYRRETLNLTLHLKPNELAGFWVRFLCHVIDVSIIAAAHLVMVAVPMAMVAGEFPLGSFIGGAFFAGVAVAFVAVAGAKHKQASMGGMALGGITGMMFAAGNAVPPFGMAFPFVFYFLIAYNAWMYFTVNEATTSKSTIGKESFGVIVQRVAKGTQMTIGQATGRHFGRMLCYVLGGLPFLTCAFQSRKQALHDIMAKTEVVFRGDK